LVAWVSGWKYTWSAKAFSVFAVNVMATCNDNSGVDERSRSEGEVDHFLDWEVIEHRNDPSDGLEGKLRMCVFPLLAFMRRSTHGVFISFTVVLYCVEEIVIT
jgi:hypothetical protein